MLKSIAGVFLMGQFFESSKLLILTSNLLLMTAFNSIYNVLLKI